LLPKTWIPSLRELSRHVPNRLREFEQAGEADLAYDYPGVARFRVNIFRQRTEISVALRVISENVPQLSDLCLPSVIETLAHVPRGLILLTGATGSGKTTTLAGIINHINENYARHIRDGRGPDRDHAQGQALGDQPA